MLLIDGVKYELWTPPNENEFEQVVKEHAQEIFGEHSIYIDIKHKIRSGSGIGSIPDGYVVILGDRPEWHIVEVELSWHPLHEHIVSQVSKFINGIKNLSTQREIAGTIYDEILRDDFCKLKVKKATEPLEIYKFLLDLISKPPVLTIIIEEDTPALREAINTLAHPQIKVVEFQTYNREGAGLEVHAHLFKPLYAVSYPLPSLPKNPPANILGINPPQVGGLKGGKVTFGEMIDAGLLKDEQVLYFYHTKPFNQEQVQVVASSNQFRYKEDGHMYSKSELAKKLLIKHGFKRDEHGVRGPNYWKTEDGKLLVDLEEQVRIPRGDRG